jgi:hypothetical protein
VSKEPDRSHLADAIRLLDLIHRADEEIPTAIATVEQSKAAAITAQMELDKHQRWLGRHQELYAQALKGCERRLKRQAFISACKHTALLPINVLATACVGLSHAAWAYPRRRWLRAKLKKRIQEMHRPSEPKFETQLQKRIQAMDQPERGETLLSTSVLTDAPVRTSSPAKKTTGLGCTPEPPHRTRGNDPRGVRRRHCASST